MPEIQGLPRFFLLLNKIFRFVRVLDAALLIFADLLLDR